LTSQPVPTSPSSSAPTDEQELVPVVGADGRDYVVVTSHGLAVERWCPHKEADLADGTVVGAALKCPFHGYMFSLRNGKGLNCRFKVGVRPATLEDGVWSVREAPA
jgi:nitrite reductase/ring-hydroxylating ferredoxin subunit